MKGSHCIFLAVLGTHIDQIGLKLNRDLPTSLGVLGLEVCAKTFASNTLLM